MRAVLNEKLNKMHKSHKEQGSDNAGQNTGTKECCPVRNFVFPTDYRPRAPSEYENDDADDGEGDKNPKVRLRHVMGVQINEKIVPSHNMSFLLYICK
jgi:hypothetical protein